MSKYVQEWTLSLREPLGSLFFCLISLVDCSLFQQVFFSHLKPIDVYLSIEERTRSRCTAGLWITLFHSTSFRYDLDKRKIILRATICVGFECSPMSTWVFFGFFSFFPPPKDVHVRWTGVSTLSHRNECGGCVSALWWKDVLWGVGGRRGRRVVSTLHLELPREALATHDPELWIRKEWSCFIYPS